MLNLNGLTAKDFNMNVNRSLEWSAKDFNRNKNIYSSFYSKSKIYIILKKYICQYKNINVYTSKGIYSKNQSYLQSCLFPIMYIYINEQPKLFGMDGGRSHALCMTKYNICKLDKPLL